MMAPTNPRYDSRLGDIPREGSFGYTGRKGSRRTTGDVDEMSAITCSFDSL